jgi:glycosyltransferase involved in cell wall biosynthesis
MVETDMQGQIKQELRTPRLPAQDTSLLLCFSHLRWNFVYQRPQHLLSRAARDQPVIFLEEPLFEDVAQPSMRTNSPLPNLTVAVPILPHGMTDLEITAQQRIMLDELLASRGIAGYLGQERLITYYFTPMALRFSSHLSPGVCVYDCMDELTGFRNAPLELQLLERRLMERSAVMFTGGVSLYEAKKRLHNNVHAFPSSVDVPHFAKARDKSLAAPGDQAGIAGPRIGFFGVIDERMDTGLVDRIAALRPDWNFVMLGPVVKIDTASLPRRSNIHWLGQKSYDELPAYLSGWDIGFMPFALNEATRFISPTKTPEFLAAGRPVVSTAVPDVVRSYGKDKLVEIAADAEDFVSCAERVLARPLHPWLTRVDATLRGMTWDKTWENMAKRIAEAGKTHAAPASRTVRTATTERALHV